MISASDIVGFYVGGVTSGQKTAISPVITTDAALETLIITGFIYMAAFRHCESPRLRIRGHGVPLSLESFTLTVAPHLEEKKEKKRQPRALVKMGGIPSKPDPARFDRLQVIGAGFSRTGTNSLQLALEKVLDGPVQHGGTHFHAEKDCTFSCSSFASQRLRR